MRRARTDGGEGADADGALVLDAGHAARTGIGTTGRRGAHLGGRQATTGGGGPRSRRFLLMLATVTLAVALAASPPPVQATPAAAGPVGMAGTASPPEVAADPMAGHDHGELSVGVLADDERFHVARPVAAGSRVTLFNDSDEQVTLTAADGSFDVVLPAGTLATFPAPQRPGGYPFTSAHSAAFADVLVVE